MKKILLALCAVAMLAACNNNKKDNNMGGNMFGNDNGNNAFNKQNNGNNQNNSGRWSKQMRDYLQSECMKQAAQAPNAKELCDCWVGKVEAKFPGVNNPQQIPEEAANQLAMECLQQSGGQTGFEGFDEGEFNDFNGGNYNDNGGYNNGGYDNNNNIPNNGDDGGYDDEGQYPNSPNQPVANGKTWPAAQRQQWMMGCTTTAQQSMGISQQQAAAYCDCMTRKVEARYTFEQAVKMTTQDFSKPEWVNARMECQMNLGY